MSSDIRAEVSSRCLQDLQEEHLQKDSTKPRWMCREGREAKVLCMSQDLKYLKNLVATHWGHPSVNWKQMGALGHETSLYSAVRGR